ncbi:hypothetical protein Bwad001_12880 [Bilophila wadsworthia]|uniref:relaxase/mobilization nuclease domain-containing protein n=1 Tax=Bilophila wadsworthia TaxID=35833 RepID=UPI00068BAE9C|nr:relaxase/mobilization nuclease domain-containing protein [Bilophila wadsworthia]
MIVKKLKRTSFKKSKAAMIGGLVDYILASHDEVGKEKLALAGSRNFLTTTVAAQKKEMISVAEESIQSRMPVTHWTLSWQENEQPTREQVDEAVSLFLRGMGLAEHQTFYALHKNTGNYHMHIVVNRTHPYTQKVIQPHRGFDIDAAHKIIAEIEHRQGWAPQLNARYRVNEQGYVVKNLQRRTQIKPRPRAEDFESATGEKSAQRIAQERGHAVIQNASCWEELHAGLDAVGLRFVRKGSGAVIFVGDRAIKASSMDRNFGLSKLCKRLGEFKPGYYSERTFNKPAPEPASHVCRAEWLEYQKERQRLAEEKHHARKKREEERKELERRQRERRETATARLAPHGLSILNIARHFLKEQEQEEKTALWDRQPQPEQTERLRRFKHWLGKRSPYLLAISGVSADGLRPAWKSGNAGFPKSAHWPRRMPLIGTWSNNGSLKRWMNHGWMRPLPCTCAVRGTRGRM